MARLYNVGHLLCALAIVIGQASNWRSITAEHESVSVDNHSAEAASTRQLSSNSSRQTHSAILPRHDAEESTNYEHLRFAALFDASDLVPSSSQHGAALSSAEGIASACMISLESVRLQI